MNRSASASLMGTASHGWMAGQRSDTARLVRIARRHSRIVRVLRVTIPGLVVAALAALVLVHYLDPLRMLDKLPSVTGKLGVSGSKITMEAPRIAGVTRDGRNYEITAETAVQDITSPDKIDLRNIHATMELPDQNLVQITAASGLYNTKADQIVLRDRVTFASAHGYRGRLREAVVNVKQGTVVSEQPVEMTLPDGTVKANRLEILDSGALVRFDGGVEVTFEAAKPVVEAPAK